MSRYTREHVSLNESRQPHARLERLAHLYPIHRWIPAMHPAALAFALAFGLFAMLTLIWGHALIQFYSGWAEQILSLARSGFKT